MTAAVPDPFAPPPPVTLEAGAVVVRCLRVLDPHVVAAAGRAVAERGPDGLADWASGLLSVGARAAELATGSGQADVLAARIDAFARDLSDAAARAATAVEQVVERAADPRAGTVRVAVDQALAGLVGDVAALVSGDDAPLPRTLAAALDRSTAAAADRVERALAANAEQVRQALTGPSGPVGLLRAEVARAAEETRADTGRRIAEVRDLLAQDRGRAEESARGTAQGLAYETQVVRALTLIAAGTGAGDTVEETGTASGAHARRTGDAVLRLGPDPSGGPAAAVVVEAKTARQSTAAWRAELLAAKQNRSADAALGVVRGTARMPGGRSVLVLDATSLVVAYDPDSGDDPSLLTACVLLLRMSARTAALAGTGRGADLDAVRDALAAAADCLVGFDALDRAASQARKQTEETLRVSARLRGLLTEHLGRASRLLATRRPAA